MTEPVLTPDIEEIAELLGGMIERLSGKRVLITGGGGFLGQYFVSLLAHLNNALSSPCEVVVLDNLLTGNKRRGVDNDGTPVEFIEHDVIEPFEYGKPLDYIIHAAGIASPYFYRKYPLETLEVATVGTKNMLALALEHRVDGFLFMSSSEVYGDPDPAHVPTLESYRGNVSSMGPRACYDESKRLGETLCTIYQEIHGVPAILVRPFNVYGPGMAQTDYRVMANFASGMITGNPVRVYGTGAQTRTFCYATDAVNGFVRALLEGIPGEVYNIGNTEPEISMLDLAEMFREVTEIDFELQRVEYPDTYPADEPMRRCPDITKARRQLGYEPSVTLDDGVGRFFRWASRAYAGSG